MIHGVAHQMHQRFEQAIHDGLVGLGGFTARHERDVLVELARHISDQPLERPKHRCHRHHTQLQDGAVQFYHQPINGVMVPADHPSDLLPAKILFNAPCRMRQGIFCNHEFAC